MKIVFHLKLLFSIHALIVSQSLAQDLGSRTLSLNPYDDVVLNGAFEVHLLQDGGHELKLEGPTHVLENIKIKQQGNKLIVGDRPQDNRSLRKVSVYLHLDQITKLELNGISKLQCLNVLESEDLEISCNGIRDVLFNLKVSTLMAHFDGIGSTELIGSAEAADISCSGLGSIFASNFKVNRLRFETAGIGKAEIYADSELSVDAAGIGSVFYAGTPEVVKVNKDGIGKVKPLSYRN